MAKFLQFDGGREMAPDEQVCHALEALSFGEVENGVRAVVYRASNAVTASITNVY